MSWLERTKRTELAIFELIKSVDALLSPTGFGHDIITVTPEQSLDCELGVSILYLSRLGKIFFNKITFINQSVINFC